MQSMPFDAEDWVARQSWTWAKTYASFAPHYYVVRAKCDDREGFEAMVWHIRRHGRVRIWRGKASATWYAEDGSYYWTMGWPVTETTVINKAIPDDKDESRFPEPDEALIWTGPGGLPPEGWEP